MLKSEYLPHVLKFYVADETVPGFPIQRALVETAEELTEAALSLLTYQGSDDNLDELGDVYYFLTYLKSAIFTVAESNGWDFNGRLINSSLIPEDCSDSFSLTLIYASMLFNKARKRLERDLKFRWDEQFLWNLMSLVVDVENKIDDAIALGWGYAFIEIVHQRNIDKLNKRCQPNGEQITARDRNAVDAM